MMDSQTFERRAVPRIALSGHATVRTHAGLAVRLLDLSLHGVQIAYRGLLRPGSPCALDLPAALGGRVRGQIVWCAVMGVERMADGARALRTHSGVQFAPLPAEQHAVLTRALRDLTAWIAAASRPSWGAPRPADAPDLPVGDMGVRRAAPLVRSAHEHHEDGMAEPCERRAVPRTRLADRPDGRVRGLREVRLLDLSLAGAQIEHLDLVRLGARCTVELPPPFGALSLPAEVVWCNVIGRQRKPRDGSRLVAQSGLWFTRLAGAQHAALADTLQNLAATRQPIVDSDRRSA